MKGDWWEIKMGVLLVFIVVMLVVGAGARNNFKPNTDAVKPVMWWLRAPLNDRLGVTFRAPWLMTEADLTWGRVVYNLLTKPGFRWLLLELGMGVVIVIVMVKGVGWIWDKAWGGINTLATSTFRVQIAGTVVIANSQGVIYAADGAGEAMVGVGEEVYGFYVAEVKISIIRQ